MESKALLFFDVDGTLLREDNRQIPLGTAEALRAAGEKGHLRFVNTGRPYTHIASRVFALGLDGYLCSAGQYIRVGDRVLLDARPDMSVCAYVRDLSRECGVYTVCEAEEGAIYDGTRPELPVIAEMRAYFEEAGTCLTVTGDMDTPGFRFDKFVVWKNEGADMSRFLQGISAYFDPIDRVAFYECVLKGYTKATAMDMLITSEGLWNRRTFAFGDGPNDRPMLKRADVSVVMGNAPESMKGDADFVTKPINEDGIAYALRHYQLI